jgi:benzoyl-CoA reductase/2-hydroxyglutaryl-CoA dehydratase subunit BcrC/BadD/HgdB
MDLQQLSSVLKMAAKKAQEETPLRSVSLFYDLMANYFQRAALVSEQRDVPFAILHMYTPSELFYAMDIVPLHAEFYVLFATPMTGVQAQFDAAAAYGTPIEACSAQRAMIGMAKNGLIPKPDFIVSSSAVCDAEIKSFEVLAKHFQCSHFTIDQPYWDNPQGIDYYIQELEELISFLEGHTGKKLQRDRLRETVELSRQATLLYQEISHYRKTPPSPMRNLDFFNLCTLYCLLAGTREAIDYFQTVKSEVKAQVEGKGEVLRAEEKFRLSCVFCVPCFAMDILDWMEQEHGVTIASDLGGFWLREEAWDPANPLESLAKKAFYSPLALPIIGPVDNWCESAVRMSREYQVDGAVVFAPITCKQGCATLRVVKDAIQDQLGIPTLVADCDIIDPSVVSPDELKSKLEGFFETLEEHKI